MLLTKKQNLILLNPFLIETYNKPIGNRHVQIVFFLKVLLKNPLLFERDYKQDIL